MSFSEYDYLNGKNNDLDSYVEGFLSGVNTINHFMRSGSKKMVSLPDGDIALLLMETFQTDFNSEIYVAGFKKGYSIYQDKYFSGMNIADINVYNPRVVNDAICAYEQEYYGTKLVQQIKY